MFSKKAYYSNQQANQSGYSSDQHSNTIRVQQPNRGFTTTTITYSSNPSNLFYSNANMSRELHRGNQYYSDEDIKPKCCNT